MNSVYPCKKCNGTGIYFIDKHYESECLYCNGEGKIDWIDNIFDIEIEYSSIIASYIKKLVNKIMDKYEIVKDENLMLNEIKSVIYNLKQNRLLYDYYISEIPNKIANRNVRDIMITLRPRITLDHIQLKIVIAKD